MSLLVARVSRTFLIAALAAFLLAVAAFSQAADAASVTTRAERAVKVAAVHKYGVGTKIKVQCKRYGKIFGCALAASPRSVRAVYVGRATVTRRMKVVLKRPICVGADCKK